MRETTESFIETEFSFTYDGFTKWLKYEYRFIASFSNESSPAAPLCAKGFDKLKFSGKYFITFLSQILSLDCHENIILKLIPVKSLIYYFIEFRNLFTSN